MAPSTTPASWDKVYSSTTVFAFTKRLAKPEVPRMNLNASAGNLYDWQRLCEFTNAVGWDDGGELEVPG